MTTTLDIITQAFLEVGAFATSESIPAADAQDALGKLNRMLDAWRNERLMLYQLTRETFNLVASQQSYTIGSGGNFNTNRPLSIERAGVEVQSTNPVTELPVDIVSDAEWQQIRVKAITSTYPRKLWVQGGMPLVTLWVWPVPSEVNKLVLYSWPGALLAQFAALTTTLSLPPGYEEALISNLAMRLYPSYGTPINPVVEQTARESKALLKRTNTRQADLRCDPMLYAKGRGFNYLTGD